MAESFLSKNDYTRVGPITVGRYFGDPAGASISAPSAPTVNAYTWTRNEVPFDTGGRFNVTGATPGADRDVKIAYIGIDANNNAAVTDFSPATTVSPEVGDNGLLVEVADVPTGVLAVLVSIDGIIAQWLPSPSRTRRSGSSAELLPIPVIYEPSAYALPESEVLNVRASDAPLVPQYQQLGQTSGTIEHTINFTQVDVETNIIANDLITTKTDQMFSFTFKGPKVLVHSLLTGGVSFTGSAGCEQTIHQVGFRHGSCVGNAFFDIAGPADNCGEKLINTVFYGKIIHGDGSMNVPYSSTEASNVPFMLREAPFQIGTGTPSLNWVPLFT